MSTNPISINLILVVQVCKKTSLLRVQDEITGIAKNTHKNVFFKKCNSKDFNLPIYPKRTNSKTGK